MQAVIISVGGTPASRSEVVAVMAGRNAMTSTTRAADPPEQRAITRTYARPPAHRLRLLRPVPRNDEIYEPRAPAPRLYSERREPLALLSLQLLEKASLNRVPADGKVPDLGEQYRRLRARAHTIELDC